MTAHSESSSSVPAYLLSVEPEYEHLEVYDRVEEEGISTRMFTTSIAAIILPLIGIIVAIIVYTMSVQSNAATAVSSQASYPVLLDASADAEQALGQYAVVDAEAGIYRIPIEEAIKSLANESWQTSSAAVESETP